MSSKPSVQLANALGPSNQALASRESVVWVQEKRWPQEPWHPVSHPVPHYTRHRGRGRAKGGPCS